MLYDRLTYTYKYMFIAEMYLCTNKFCQSYYAQNKYSQKNNNKKNTVNIPRLEITGLK